MKEKILATLIVDEHGDLALHFGELIGYAPSNGLIFELFRRLKKHPEFLHILKKEAIIMKREGKAEDLLKRHFRRLLCVWEHDRKCRLVAPKKITEEERIHVEDFLFWLQGQNCRIQEPDHFAAKVNYDKVCWMMIKEAKKKAE